MFPRVGGAALAVVAAGLLVVSLVTHAWWAGHPQVNDRVITAKDVTIGVFSAEGCNTGGDRSCQVVEIKGAFVPLGYAATATTGALVLSSLLLALLTWAQAERRKGFGKLTIFLTVLAAVVGAIVILVGPEIEAAGLDVVVPLGYGVYLFGGGMVCAFVASLLAMQPTPPVQLAPPGWQSHPARGSAPTAPPPAAADMLAMLHDDGLRPSAPGAYPGPGAPPPSALFAAAPQLRPLYEAAPLQGGTGGFVPQHQPPPPYAPPAPLPRAAIGATLGIPTPPPMDIAQFVDGPSELSDPLIEPPPPMPGFEPGLGFETPAPIFDPPPPVPAPAATPPPPPPPAAAPRLPGMPPPRPTGPTTVPPPLPAPRIGKSLPPPIRAKPPTLVPPVPGRRPVASTIAAASVPPPSVPFPAPGAVAKLAPRGETEPVLAPPQRYQTELGMSEPFDAAETAALEKVELDESETAAVPKQDLDALDSAAISGSLSGSFESSTAEQPLFDPRMAQATDQVPSLAHSHAEPEPEPEPAAAPPPRTLSGRIPITTAPDNLAPPSDQQSASSGPSPACPQCESPMAWVEAHLRFYCRSCKMYF